MKRKAAPYNSRQRKLIQEINKNQRSREHTNYVKKLNREQVAATKHQLEHREESDEPSATEEDTVQPLVERKRRQPEKPKAQLPRLKLAYEIQLLGSKQSEYRPEMKVERFELPNPLHWVDCDFCRQPVSALQCMVSSCFGVQLHYHPSCLDQAVALKR